MQTTAPGVTSLPTGTWNADPMHSYVGFRVGHMGSGTFRGAFGEVTASLDDGVLRGRVPVESIELKVPQLRGHVLSPEFFDVANHGEIEFESTSIEAGEDGTLTVAGDLTINGRTKSVVATGRATEPAVGMQGSRLFGLELSTTVDRRDYGLEWNAELPGGNLAVAWDVTLDVTLELTEASGETAQQAA